MPQALNTMSGTSHLCLLVLLKHRFVSILTNPALLITHHPGTVAEGASCFSGGTKAKKYGKAIAEMLSFGSKISEYRASV